MRRLRNRIVLVWAAALAAAVACDAGPGTPDGGAAGEVDSAPPLGVDVSEARVHRVGGWPEVTELEEPRPLYPADPVDPPEGRPPLSGVADLLPRPGGGVYVANGDFRSILALDGDGGVEWRAGGEGGGPAEFDALSGLQAWAGDTLVAVDGGANAVSFWTGSGAFVRAATAGPLPPTPAGDPLIALPGTPVGVLDDGRIAARGPERAFGAGRAGLRRTRTSITLVAPGRDTATAFVLPGPWVYELETPQRLPAVAAPMGGATAVAVAHGRPHVDLVWARSDTFRVLLLDAGGRARRIHEIGEPREPVTQAVRSRFREGWSPWLDVEEEIPFPERVPAFDRAFVADDGAVWARRYHYRWSGEGEEWLRFSADGEADRYRFPPRAEVMAATRDVAWAVRRKELDVEQVVAFELPR